MKYTTAIFDLDGTITDSAPGILNSIRYALEKKGIRQPSEEVLRSFIGPPLKEQFQCVFGLTAKEGEEMVSLYRQYYGDKGIFENRVYDGVMEMLENLKRSGIRILMATSKPEKYAIRIAEHFGFGRYFEFIGGACMDGTRTAKHEVIEHVLKACGIPENERDNTVMIGDSQYRSPVWIWEQRGTDCSRRRRNSGASIGYHRTILKILFNEKFAKYRVCFLHSLFTIRT